MTYKNLARVTKITEYLSTYLIVQLSMTILIVILTIMFFALNISQMNSNTTLFNTYLYAIKCLKENGNNCFYTIFEKAQ